MDYKNYDFSEEYLAKHNAEEWERIKDEFSKAICKVEQYAKRQKEKALSKEDRERDDR